MSKKYDVGRLKSGSLSLELELEDGRDFIINVGKSTKYGGTEGYVVRIMVDNPNGDTTRWSRNVFGLGLYAKDMAEKHFKALCNCAIEGYEDYIVNKTRRGCFGIPVEDFVDYIYKEMYDVRARVDRDNVVEDDAIKFSDLFEFEKKWGNKDRIRIVR